MDGNSQTSFIPKRPLVPSEGPVSYESRGVSIVTVITVILFLGVVTLSIGSYFYQKVLVDTLDKKKATLEQARKGFDLNTIKQLKRLDTRIQTAKSLLDSHIAISGIFDVLQAATLKTIAYKNFSILSAANADAGEGAAPGGGSIQFRMDGVAGSYNSVALQSDLLSKTKGIKEPIFSNIGLNDKGNVIFSVSALIDPALLKYRYVNDFDNTTQSKAVTSDTTPTPAPSTTTIPVPFVPKR